ncbi:MAG: OmpA family protein [Gammaproteobacteria bacterium]|nr:OmpA family protein [Gammaproteobacteria bacterium]
MRYALLLAGLLCACVGPAALAQTRPTSAEFSIEVTAETVAVRGAISSDGHEAILRETIAHHFADRKAGIDLSFGPSLPPGWALITEVTLEAMAVATSATAAITTEAVAVRGFTEDGATWRNGALRIQRSLLPGMRFENGLVELRRAASMSRQCIELFRMAKRGRRIEFEPEDANLGTAAKPLLDELIQIAADCPDARIEIIGHTDSSGVEAANTALSQARANAVLAYLVSGGIAVARIDARGVGSSVPLTDESSAPARRINRRIEIELRFPQ